MTPDATANDDPSNTILTTPAGRRGSVASLALASYGAIALGVVTGPIQARALGPAARGQLAAIASYAVLGTLMIGLGVPVAVKRAAVAGERVRSLQVASNRYALLLLPASACLGAVLIAGPISDVSPPARWCALGLILLVPLGVVRSCYQGILIAQGRLRPLAAMRIAPIAASAALTLAAFSISKLTLSVAVAGLALMLLVELAVVLRALGSAPGRAEPLGPLLKFGVRGLGGQLAETANLRLDSALLVSLVPASSAGFYAVAATIALLPNAMSHALTTRAFSGIASADVNNQAPLAAASIRRCIAASLLMCAGLAAVTPLCVPVLYGENFRSSVLLVILLLPGTVFFAAAYAAANALVAIGRPTASAVGQLVGTAVTAAAIAPVARAFGVRGVAILACANYFVAACALLRALAADHIGRWWPSTSDFTLVLRDISRRVWPSRALEPQT